MQVDYPIIADPTRDLAVKLGMLDPVAKDAAGLPLAARAVFVIGPDNKLKLSILYPATTGRNFHEVSGRGDGTEPWGGRSGRELDGWHLIRRELPQGTVDPTAQLHALSDVARFSDVFEEHHTVRKLQ